MRQLTAITAKPALTIEVTSSLTVSVWQLSYKTQRIFLWGMDVLAAIMPQRSLAAHNLASAMTTGF